MEHFLLNKDTATDIIKQISQSDYARLWTYRLQLIFFGYFRDKNHYLWTANNHKLTPAKVHEWAEHINTEFELILIMEHYDISLAVMVLKLCWDIDDAIYLKVNAQPKQKKLQLSEQAKKTL